jgi:dinuclear metal center YbgI/SA1388 family protein
MAKRDELVKWLNDYLDPKNLSEYCPNGLQVEGKSEIRKIVTGVSASLEFLEEAVKMKADAVLVHHGIIWKGTWNQIRGSYLKKIKLCLENNLNLLAYHIPLDAHLEVGNAAALAKIIGLKDIKAFGSYDYLNTGVSGEFTGLKSELFDTILKEINPKAQIFDYSKDVKRVFIATGAAQDDFRRAISEGADVFLTGEVSEWVFHMAKEEKRTFIAAGHHASESYGVQRLAEKMAKQFSIDFEHLDVHNPV